MNQISIKKCFNSSIPSAWKITILPASFPLLVFDAVFVQNAFRIKTKFFGNTCFFLVMVLVLSWSLLRKGELKKYYKSILMFARETFKFFHFAYRIISQRAYPLYTRLRKQVPCDNFLKPPSNMKEKNQTKSKLNRGKITHFSASIFHRQLTMVASHAFSRTISGFVLDFRQNREELILKRERKCDA